MNFKRVISGLIGFIFVVLVFIFGNVHIIDVLVSAIAVISI